jgi:mannose/fructose/N-acetylgalactosamine-specific phosphotransferase system component IID
MWRDHLNTVWRLFFIASSRNSKTIDGLGFYHALAPRFSELAATDGEFEDLAARHLGYFNANPLLASFVVGAVANLEERRRAGDDISRERIESAKRALSSVSTAKGDYFFDVVLLPLALTIASIFAIYHSYIGLVIFLALYNIYHFRSRLGGYLGSVQLGEGVGREFIAGLFREQGLLAGCAAFAAGAFAALAFTRALEAGGIRYAGMGVAAVAVMVGLQKRFSLLASVSIVFCAFVILLYVW